MSRLTRFTRWLRSSWHATLWGLGVRRPAARITLRWNRPGPPPDLSRISRPAWLRPDDELGVACGTRVVLFSDDRRAASLVDCIGYSTGFEFTLAYRSRDDLPMGFLRDFSDAAVVRIGYPDGAEGDSVESGRAAMNAHYEAAYAGMESPAPAAPLVMAEGGGGGGKRMDMRYWCWPLPPAGWMTITVAWKLAGVPETTVKVDAAAIREAGLRSAKLWPA